MRRVGLLGPVVVLDDASVVPIGSARVRALVASLALAHPGVVSTTRLIEDIWPDKHPQNPLSALHTQISRLRTLLGADAVEAVAGGYRLTLPAPASDLAVAEDALRGGDAPNPSLTLALWRGDAGTGLPGHLAATVSARTERIHHALRQQDWNSRLDSEPETVAAEIAGDRADHPLDEHLAALQMRALLASGDPNRALQVHAGISRLLADGLGTDPGPELAAAHSAALAYAPFARTPAPPPTSFVARSAPLDELRRRVGPGRVVTVTGPGGIGKSRLVFEYIAAGTPANLFVDFSSVRRDDDLAALVSAALGRGSLPEPGIRSRTDGPTAAGIAIASSAPPGAVVILDGCEHAPDAARRLTESLLHRRDDTAVIVTSRVPLGVAAEQTIRLDPITDDSAATLFVDRARAARAGASLDLELVAVLCDRLDGSPLALELAAAQLRHLSLRDIVDRLDERFALLTGAGGDNRGLAEVMEASWALLDDAARATVTAVAVFPGDVALEDALAVDGATLGGLAALCDHSLASVVDGPDAHTRYHLTDTVREFVRAKTSGDATMIASFIEWARTSVRAAVADARTGDVMATAARLDENSDAVLSAIDVALEVGQSPTELMPAVTWRWVRTGDHPGTEEIAVAAVRGAHGSDDLVGVVFATLHLALAGRHRDAARARSTLRRLSGDRPDPLAALAVDLLVRPARSAPRTLAGAARSADPTVVSVAELIRADGAERGAAPALARRAALHALVSAQRAGNVWLTATARHRLGRLASQLGDHTTAAVHFETAGAEFARIGFTEDACRVRVHHALALVEVDPGRARDLVDAALVESGDSARPFVATAHMVRAQLLLTEATPGPSTVAADLAVEIVGPALDAHAVFLHAVRIAVLTRLGSVTEARVAAEELRAALRGRAQDPALSDLPALGAAAAAIALAHDASSEDDLMRAARAAAYRRDFPVLTLPVGSRAHRTAAFGLMGP